MSQELLKIVREMIAEIGPCSCGSEYINIGRLDPNCTYHRVWGFDSDRRLRELLDAEVTTTDTLTEKTP